MKWFWNFIARSGEEIVQARKDWEEGSRFGEVQGYDGARLPAPELPTTPLKPRGRVR
ncbi:pirin [Streptomyces californicus]|nr:pirin [Streptomyces californicus]